MDLSSVRQDYRQQLFDISHAHVDPFEQLKIWLQESETADLPLHNAMTLATVDTDGMPQARIVLLKGIRGRGLDFYTNTSSAKATQLQFEPRASVLFFWSELERQVRISGECQPLCREDVERYHRSRPRSSQISAWASAQSTEVPDRATLEQAWDHMAAEFEGKEVPAPPYWGGYRLIATRFEFWQGRESRLHDRIVYQQEKQDSWSRHRLSP